MFMHRTITGNIRTLSIKRDTVGDWFVTITAEIPREESQSPAGAKQQIEILRPVGTDLGLTSIITTSEGLQVEPPQYLRKSEKRLERAQRELSRKKEGSGKRSKTRKRVAKIHRKINRQRDDFSHKISRNLVSNHDLIAFEGLNINGMVRNHHLAKSISDAGWNKIIQYTMYKAESAGICVVMVEPRHTSQKCSRCGNIKHDLKLSDHIYHCNICDLTIDRDLNAAINVLNDALIKIGRGTPKFTPVEIEALPVRATSVVETGSPQRQLGEDVTYELLDQTSDIRIRIFGNSTENIILNAILAFNDIIYAGEEEKLSGNKVYKLNFFKPDLLVVDILSWAILELDSNNVLIKPINISVDESISLLTVTYEESIAKDGSSFRFSPKGATYNDVIFDLKNGYAEITIDT